MSNDVAIKTRQAANDDIERVQNLVFGVLREHGLSPDLNGTDRDLNDIEANYTNRGGVFELIEDSSGELLGTVGLYAINGDTVELRKMYFVKHFRGKGYGQKTVARMIEKARELGFKKVYLETASVLKVAVHIYEKFGFKTTGDKHTPRCDQAYMLVLE